MSWLTLDDNMGDHPKILALSDSAFRLHIYGLLYCSRHLTDGNVPASICRGIVANPSRSCRELVAKKLWIRRGNDYEIRDYLDWNLSRTQVEDRRNTKRRAGIKGAQARWHPDEADDGTSHSNRMAARHAPIPSPIKEGLDLGETMDSDAARYAAIAARGVKSVNGHLGRPVARQPKAGCAHDMQRKDSETWKCSVCGLEQVD